MDFKEISLYIMAIIYIAAGLNHFKNAKFYIKIIPPYLPFPKWLNWISGVAEIILGIMLFFPEYRSLAAWGIIALLIAVFPANIYHFTSKGKTLPGLKAPLWGLALRLPFQFVFIYWAYLYT